MTLSENIPETATTVAVAAAADAAPTASWFAEPDHAAGAKYAIQLEKELGLTVVPPGLDLTQKQRMLDNKMYDPMSEILLHERKRVRDITRAYNVSSQNTPEDLMKRRALLHMLFNGQIGSACWIEPPFNCDYGVNITLGRNVFMNFNCVILDCCKVTIGNDVFFAPNVQLYGATHPLNPLNRYKLVEYGMDITIGNNVWIGGGSVICPGVTIGDGVTVGAGSVVTKNVPPYTVVGGNPAKILRVLNKEECERESREFDILKKQGKHLDDWTPAPRGTLALPPM